MQSIDIFPWDDNFNTGLPLVDEQHHKLVQLLNLLASHVAFRADVPQLNGIFDELANYTVYHFETEEAIWAEYLAGDVAEAEHRQTHRKFVDTVLRLKEAQATRPLTEVAEEALGFLARWLASHILETDRRMAYAVLAMRDDGLALADAKARADMQMSGATRVLIDIILSIYDTLSTNTLHLMRELAERKRSETELVEARLRAEAANLAKNRFLSNMSHELRTPLNGIMGMAQLLLDPELAEVERQEYARTIMSSGEALLEMVNRILDLSQVESGQLVLEKSALAPRRLMAELDAAFAPAVQGKGLQFHTEVDAALAEHYVGDAGRLRQMLDHLLSNAIKFTSHGEIRVTVRQTERHAGHATLEFAVADSGIGIAPDQQALLFRPFSQIDDSTTRQFGGAGLGLSLVRSLAELMSGEVGLESTPGRCTRIWFRVPLETAG